MENIKGRLKMQDKTVTDKKCEEWTMTDKHS